MRKAYFQNFINTAFLVILSFFFIGCTFAIAGRNVFLSEAKKSMEESAHQIAEKTVVIMKADQLQNSKYNRDLAIIAAGTGQDIFITGPDATIITCSDLDSECPHIGTRLHEDIRFHLTQDSDVSFLGTLNGYYETQHYAVASPIVDEQGTLLGFVFVTKDAVEALDIWTTILPLFIAISLIVLFIAVIVGLFTSRRIAKPLQNLAKAANEFGHGDYSVRVNEIQGENEVAYVLRSFNSMADSLEKSEEERREFIANVSHELKTPMTSISGFADGILDGTIPQENEKHYLEIISSETKRLNRLVRSMLELSRLQTQDKTTLLSKKFRIDEVILRTMLSFEDKIEKKNLQVETDLPEKSIYVSGNADAITQVVYNLTDNAIKFSPEGGKLSYNLWKDDQKAHIEIGNDGPTISKKELSLIFNRFHKSDRSRSQDKDGVGLGLYICKTIINNHNEEIHVTSENNHTVFSFTLPLQS